MSQIGLWLSTAWAWWVQEFLGLWPKSFVRRLARSRPRILIHAEDGFTLVMVTQGDEVRFQERLSLPPEGDEAKRVQSRINQALGRGKPQIIAVLSEDNILKRTIHLPRAANAHLYDAVGYQLARLSPFPEAETMFDICALPYTRTAQQIPVEVRLAAKHVVENHKKLALAFGQTIEAFAIASNDDNKGFDFFDFEPRSRKAWKREAADWAFTAALAAFILSLSAMPFVKEIRTAQALEEQVQKLKPKADEVLKLVQERDRLLALRMDVAGQKKTSLPPLPILAKLSELMDDEAYLLEFRLEGSSVTITGFATDASRLIQRLQAAPELKSVRFAGPVVRDLRTARDRFTLILDRGGAT